MIKKSIVLLMFVILALNNIYAADKTESIVIKKLYNFTDEIIKNFEIDSAKAVVGIADFENKSERAEKSNIGFAVSDIISQRLTELDQFVVVESSQIEKIIDTLKLGLTGLYDEKTVASIGNLVGAEYMVLGSVTDIGGFYRINTRVVRVETGITIVNENLEIDSVLLEKESQKYMPPRYRIMLGSSLTYNPQDFDLSFNTLDRDYNLGISAGFYYDFKPDHSLSAIINYYVLNMGDYKDDMDYSDGIPEPGTYSEMYYMKSYISIPFQYEIMLGYGYKIEVSKYLSARTNLYAGYLVTRIKTYIRSGYRDPIAPYDDIYYSERKTHDSGTIFINPTIDFMVNESNPLSFIISLGYRYAFKDFNVYIPKDYDPITFDEVFNLSGFNLRMGLQLYI
ncbi:MAG: hypothetical protein H7A26_00880 [Spirochaetales bacterium]|nr:hypothetical protein [Spirochaetales bacterium]